MGLFVPYVTPIAVTLPVSAPQTDPHLPIPPPKVETTFGSKGESIFQNFCIVIKTL